MGPIIIGVTAAMLMDSFSWKDETRAAWSPRLKAALAIGIVYQMYDFYRLGLLW